MGTEILDDGSLETIYVVGHSHHDYAWERERQWHILRYCLLFNEMLDWLKSNPKATWLIDNAIHSLAPFFDNYPERLEEFRQHVKSGRIEIANGGYSLARPSYVGEETFVRNLQAGDEYFKKTLKVERIPLYYNVDTAPGQRQMPQILTLAGFRYYRFQRPEVTLDQKKVPRAFWWEGLDGSKILVSRGAGIGFLDAQYTNQDVGSQWDKIRRAFYTEELAPRRPEGLCAHDIELIPYGCDDSRPNLNWYDKKIRLDEFVSEWNKKERKEKVAMKFGVPTTYFKELEKKELPIYGGALDESELTFNLPAKGDASMWRMRGDLDKLLVRLENMCAMCSLVGIQYPEAEIGELWLQLFEITGHAIDWVLSEDNDELWTIAQNAKTKAEIMLGRCLDNLAKAVRYSAGQLAVVANTQAVDRHETVRMCITGPLGVKEFALHDAFGNVLEYQIVGRNSFFCVPEAMRRQEYVSVDVIALIKVPAFGYNAISVKYEDSPILKNCEQLKLASLAESEIFDAPDVEIDAGEIVVSLSRGKITKLKNKASRKTILPEGGGSLYSLRCVFTGPYKSWMYENEVVGESVFSPTEWKLIENGPLCWRYRVHGSFSEQEGQNATLDILIKRGSPAIEFELELNTKPVDCYYTVDFCCNESTRSYADVYYGVEERDTNGMVYNYGEAYIEGQIYARNFVSFEQSGEPLALVSKNCSVYYIHEPKKRRMSLMLTRNCVYKNSDQDWVRKMPEAFSLDGKNHFCFALMAAETYGKFGDVQQYAKKYHHPLLVGKKYNKNTEGAPESCSFISNLNGALVQSAIYRKNNRLHIRLFETNGEEAELSLGLPDSAVLVKSVDFLGNELESQFDFDPKTHKVTGKIGPFKIMTLEIFGL
ncbi:MAG: hypothetical protein FWH48_00675 [Oscillospiraceae bacterium]|nr:hypothetical protein [Oscillospiraceae bacterium]